MSPGPTHDGQCLRKSQRGAALLLTLALIGLLVAMFVVVLVNDLVRENKRRQQTAESLAKAKEALIGFSAKVDLWGDRANAAPCSGTDCPRPGELPCPDLNDDGEAEGSCGNATETTGQTARLGRLPWKTLGLPDLRDGEGERLWYAVSARFKNQSRRACLSSGGCLNSQTPGTITLSDRSGTVVNDGSDPIPPSGVVAVILAPGAVLQRDGAGAAQDRSCAGGGCNSEGACTSSPASLTAKCNPVNYLDVVSGGEDNADFVDGDSFNGFIDGPAYIGSRLIVNDQILAIKHDDIMPVVERRVAREVMNCLKGYASGSHDRYPWAASPSLSAGGDYSSRKDYRFGRMPENFDQTLLGITLDELLQPTVNLVCGLLPALCMSNAWPGYGPQIPVDPPAVSCYLEVGTWWDNWKEEVFYGVATGYRAGGPTITLLPPLITLGVSSPAGCASDCLAVSPISPAADKRIVVVVAGRRLAAVASGQPRGTTAQKSNLANYLEGANATINPTGTTTYTFQNAPRSSTFNDTVEFQ